ncbi:hypothetical protein ACFQ9X_25715 [Catenulispora yoronensis]
MSGRHAAPATGTAPAAEGPDLKRRAITIGLVLIAAVLTYLAATAYVPRWWSQRIGHAVNGQMSTGTLLGFCFGFVFTIVPLGLLWITMRRQMSWKMRVFWLALAVILAAPNLMTLGVAAGEAAAPTPASEPWTLTPRCSAAPPASGRRSRWWCSW